MKLSVTAKESIKTALAMTIAYGIALSMDWDTPMWAGFSVAFVSLSTTGQSFNKSAMRMLGTMIAAIAALCLIALFPQDRWLFILALSIYVGFCTYMMGAAKYQYFWYVCGYVCIIVSLEAGPNSVHAFELAILRTQETGLGILVYSVVAVVLWPISSVGDFNAIVAQLNSTQHKLYRSYFSLMNGQGTIAEAQALLGQDIQQQTLFKSILSAAETDSYEIGQQRKQWRRHQNQLSNFTAIMTRWQDSFTAVETVDKQRIMPNLVDFNNELEQRFEQIERMLKGSAPAHRPRDIELQLDKDALKSLSHFQQSAILATHTSLQELEPATQALLNGVSEIKSFSHEPGIAPIMKARAPWPDFAFDIERLASIVQITAVLWLSFLAFIYVYDLPGGIFLIVVSGVIGMPLAADPNKQVSSMFMPFTNSVLFCTVLYAFVMPQLTSFIGLGTMIFLVTFIICYRYSSPQQEMGRTVGLAVFVTMIAIENHQTYNILIVYNAVMVFIGMFIIFLITAYIPFSPRPERAFMRLQSRFFHSCEYLISGLSATRDRPLSFWERRRRAFHLREIKTLPNKILARGGAIKTELLPGSSKEQIDAISSHFQVTGMRIQAFLESQSNPPAQFLIDELHVDSQAWRNTMQDACQSLSKNPIIEHSAEFHNKLDKITGHLEARIESVLNKTDYDQLSETDRDNFYRLLGAYRGLSDALFEYCGNARLINWADWHDSRF